MFFTQQLVVWDIRIEIYTSVLLQVVEKYLKQYKIPEGVRICSPTWIDFFGVFVER